MANVQNTGWNSTYDSDYIQHAQPSKLRETPTIPRLRDIEPVLMPRPFILKSKQAAGKPSGRLEDPYWSSIYKQSYKPHHMTRYENYLPTLVTTARPTYNAERPVFLPALPVYLSPTVGSFTDRPVYHIRQPRGSYSDRTMNYDPLSTWTSVYKESFRGAQGTNSAAQLHFDPILYTNPQHNLTPRYNQVEAPIKHDQARENLVDIENNQYDNLPSVRSQKQGLDSNRNHGAPVNERFHQSSFIDHDFDTEQQTIILSQFFPEDRIRWLRADQLSTQPKLFAKKFVTNDFKRGILSNTWFLVACAALARHPKLINIVMASNQPLGGEAKSGKISCNFNLFGLWKTIVIDDQLPCTGQDLAFSRSDDPDEFWISFLEKAYAKVFGGYNALQFGRPEDALADLTGGICEFYSLHESLGNRVDIAHALFMASKLHAMITCSRVILDENNEQEFISGMVASHGYEVTGVFVVPWSRGEEEIILRIQAPWTYSKTSTGAWSDMDPRWRTFSKEFKDFVGFNNKPSGEFFINYNDFLKQFYHVLICHLQSPLYPNQSIKENGFFWQQHGQWTSAENAGGSAGYASYSSNPQYLVTLEEPAEMDPLYQDYKNILIVSLILPDTRGSTKSYAHTGFSIYQVDSQKSYIPLTNDYLSVNKPILTSGRYKSQKMVTARFRVEAREIILIPCTYYPDRDSPFLLRIFCDAKMNIQTFQAK